MKTKSQSSTKRKLDKINMNDENKKDISWLQVYKDETLERLDDAQCHSFEEIGKFFSGFYECWRKVSVHPYTPKHDNKDPFFMAGVDYCNDKISQSLSSLKKSKACNEKGGFLNGFKIKDKPKEELISILENGFICKKDGTQVVLNENQKKWISEEIEKKEQNNAS